METIFEKLKVKTYSYEIHHQVMVVDGIRYRRAYSTYDNNYYWSMFDVKKRTFVPIPSNIMLEHYRNDFNLERIYQVAIGNPLYDNLEKGLK